MNLSLCEGYWRVWDSLFYCWLARFGWVYRSKAWARIPSDKGKSFQHHSSECILLGYIDDAKAYKLMEIATRRCFIKWGVQFNEDPLHDLQPAEEEGINAQSIRFAYDDFYTDFLY